MLKTFFMLFCELWLPLNSILFPHTHSFYWFSCSCVNITWQWYWSCLEHDYISRYQETKVHKFNPFLLKHTHKHIFMILISFCLSFWWSVCDCFFFWWKFSKSILISCLFSRSHFCSIIFFCYVPARRIELFKRKKKIKVKSQSDYVKHDWIIIMFCGPIKKFINLESIPTHHSSEPLQKRRKNIYHKFSEILPLITIRY